jgi:Transposase DDE domain
VYRADAATCNACPLKEHSTESQYGRSLKRSFDEESLEQVRASHSTEPYQKAMRKRSVWVEPFFCLVLLLVSLSKHPFGPITDSVIARVSADSSLCK